MERFTANRLAADPLFQHDLVQRMKERINELALQRVVGRVLQVLKVAAVLQQLFIWDVEQAQMMAT